MRLAKEKTEICRSVEKFHPWEEKKRSVKLTEVVKGGYTESVLSATIIIILDTETQGNTDMDTGYISTLIIFLSWEGIVSGGISRFLFYHSG